MRRRRQEPQALAPGLAPDGLLSGGLVFGLMSALAGAEDAGYAGARCPPGRAPYLLMAALAGEDIPCDPGERGATHSEEW